jgi:hypothetical protein
LSLLLIGAAYLTWGISWPGVLAAGIVGVLLSQAMHSTGWREVLTTAGAICLAAAAVGAFILLIQMFLSF